MDSIIEYIKSFIKSNSDKEYPSNLPEGISIKNFAQTKLVLKPWGFELWLSEAKNTPYALKLIHLKKGTKTSLQFHKEKAEHNCLFTGRANLHYKDSKTNKITHLALSPGDVIEILPQSIHRIEALTDIILIEASTQHLDDIVRLSDDYQRPDGKIESEHREMALLSQKLKKLI